MSRIFKKTMTIIIISVILVFTAFAVFSIYWTSDALETALEEKAYYQASTCSNQISMIFENAEGTVDTLAADITNEFDIKEMKQNPEYNNEFINWHAPIIKDALEDIEDSLGLYITFNPDLTHNEGVHEIWYTYGRNGKIAEMDPETNGVYQEAFLQRDAPNMAYYFAAINNPGEGIWTDPALDPDMGIRTLAYSRAVFIDNSLVGVIGTDISTDHTTDLIRNMNIENNGEVFLLNSDRELVVSSVKKAEQEKRYSKEINDKCVTTMKKHEDGKLHTTLNNDKVIVSYNTLSNGWMLAIIIREKDLFAPVNLVTAIIIMLSIFLSAMAILMAYWALRKYASPVDKATELLHMMELESQLDEAEKANVQTDDDIESLVQKAVNRQRTSDLMMAHQAKLAQAGEMVNNIIHQWKQPLNNINILLGNLRDDAKYGELTEEAAISTANSAEELVGIMSDTIDDFSEYLKPDVEMGAFSVDRAVNAVLKLVKDKLSSNNISADFECESGLSSFGYKNALYHIVLNVVNNAIDALKELQGKKRTIEIKAYRKDAKKIVLTIFNNGLPISDEAMEKLFTPYFTTKGQNGGTGLGLAISKNLVEGSMGGSIRLDNVHGGVMCTIEINGGEDLYG